MAHFYSIKHLFKEINALNNIFSNMFENIISKNIAIRVIIFKELLKEMLSNLNIVKATNRPKLLEKLEELQVQLNFCEKALADYLETKRLIYPRFYFISAADLLDILSNG